LAAAADRILPHVRQTLDTPQAPTFFELLTAIAWLVFRERGCREVVLETGLGGRLDATNVCRPAVTAITAIELEHTDVLGDTLEAIAGEKAGILKPGVPAVTCAVEPALGVIRRRALDLGVPLAVVGEDLRVAHAASAPGPRTTVRLEFAPPAASLADLVLPVAGAHHGVNVALAAWVSRRLGVPDADLRGALAQATLPGTLEPLGGDPLVVADGAHTPASGRAARAAADACWPTHRRVLLLAFLEGKDVAGISRDLLPGAAAVVVTRLPGPRGLEAHEAARRLGPGAGPAPCVEPDCERALERARAAAGPGGLVLATGSVRLAGLVRSLVLRSRSRGG
jgi:dihydrofolate synthase/folylpolyglutamate synthase